MTGKEEKSADAYISKDLFTKMINSEVIVLANDVEYVRKDVAVGIMESYANHKTEPLLDQLSKERETVEMLKKAMVKEPYTLVSRELEKEREMIKDKLIGFKRWYDKLSPSDKCTVWPPAGSGSGTGLYDMPDEDLIDKFLKYLAKATELNKK